ncbi:MAG TPA: hypothetical protein VK807_02175 [Gemmatimonadaceae bacterium]|jgi:hypothetical protein|nr:hypothetical protein [Gemmatimonadaceae bacterium]
MRDDPEYWEALSTRIVADVRERRQSSWLRLATWAPPLATAAVLTLLLATGRRPVAAPHRAPSIAVMLTTPGQAPSIAAMMAGEP